MKRKLAVLVAMPLVLVGCGGNGSGSGSSGGEFSSTIESQFIDAPVKGLKFSKEDGSEGLTGAAGKFSCSRGEKISFSVGGMNLGYAACGDMIFIHDLNSSAPNYSWKQAAAVIQSFATTSGGILDLTAANAANINLSSLAYQAVDTDFETDLGTAHTSANVSGTSVVNVTAAETAADSSLTSSIDLPSQLEFVLEQLVSNSEVIKLKGKLVKQVMIEDEKWCWENVEATASITEAGGIYKFNVTKAMSWDNDSVLATEGICASGEESAEECENHTGSELPKPKIITGANVDMVYSHEETDPDFGSVRNYNTISLKTSVGSGNVTVSGVFESKTVALSGEFEGQELKCQYEVSDASEVETSVTAIAPKNGTYSNATLACSNGETADVSLAMTGLSGTLTVVAPSINLPVTFKEVVETPFKKYYEFEAGEEGKAGYLDMVVQDVDTISLTTVLSVDDELVNCSGALSFE